MASGQRRWRHLPGSVLSTARGCRAGRPVPAPWGVNTWPSGRCHVEIGTSSCAVALPAAGRLVGVVAGVEPGTGDVFARRPRSGALTDRERTVLAQMAEGRSNAAIARHLHLAEKTVDSHIATLLAKLNLEPTPDDSRRVLAVLAWMRAATK
jgi:DNA-binding CsgD family transcriptional regulator